MSEDRRAGGGVHVSERTVACVCVWDKLVLVHVRVFLRKSHSGSTNTIRRAIPARKQGSFNGLRRTHTFMCAHTHTHDLIFPVLWGLSQLLNLALTSQNNPQPELKPGSNLHIKTVIQPSTGL